MVVVISFYCFWFIGLNHFSKPFKGSFRELFCLVVSMLFGELPNKLQNEISRITLPNPLLKGLSPLLTPFKGPNKPSGVKVAVAAIAAHWSEGSNAGVLHQEVP